MTAGPGLSPVASLPPVAWLCHGAVRRATVLATVLATMEAPAGQAGIASGRIGRPGGSLVGTVSAAAAVPFRGMQPMVPGKGLDSTPWPALRGSHQSESHVVAGSMAMGCCR